MSKQFTGYMDGVVKVPAGGKPSAGVDSYGQHGIEQGSDAGTFEKKPDSIASSDVLTGYFGSRK